ncbi:carboxypeptidase-like regulatory domain-containing protein [Hymenobacter sp. BT683]|uniref:Carboxypeptidase-like regulatory domain-containing protein n=1 Tax=Hymenobacter jeongseonensis TaxID=2791027 RepID=A0ABS0IK93_9BACT|nr:carboxypeptidase-like regulatory domain-containing protein [Hymenobacter jeongseonensis]MBF9238802.1 carboxypeptidase-like regulatory domain-containing protein [Hymenobacter jeongseonensis]
MRQFFLATAALSLWTALSATAQTTSTEGSKSVANRERIALSTRPATDAAPMRLACAPIIGKVYDPNGDPLVGATLLIKGTHQVYVTDSEGKFMFTEPVYEGQVLTIGAAGYTPLDVPLTECTLPRLVLEQADDARIKRNGKRAGQVVRLNNRNTNLK